jgi:hypothetical protein
MTEATEPGMPGENLVMSTGTTAAEEGEATVSGYIGSTQGEPISEGSPDAVGDLTGQPVSEMQAETDSPARPESWYESLAASPGDDTSPQQENTTSSDMVSEVAFQEEAEAPSTAEEIPSFTRPNETTDATQSAPVYTPPPQWEPGKYDMGSTQPVDVPLSDQAPPVPPPVAAPGQTQSIFSPPSPPAEGQGQYTQPMAPQQGYSPPPQAPQAPNQGYTPPPSYSNQGLPPPGTQPLQPGQSNPGYPQYQPGYPPPQQATAPKDPTTALMLELLGFLGFLGIGHIYAGKTNRGIGLLIGWLVYLTASFVLTVCLVGCFMFLAWLIVPPLSGIWVKNEMEKERMTGFRQ